MGVGKSKKKVTVLPEPVISSSPRDSSRRVSSISSIDRLPTTKQTVPLGSFYNAKNDTFLLQTPVLRILPESIKVNNQQVPPEVKFGMYSSKQLPSLVGINDDLYVSLCLNMTEQVGITSIINVFSSINTDMWIFYYQYIYQEDYIMDPSRYTQQTFPTTIQNASVTHVVTAIKTGIHVIVMLQPSSRTSTPEIEKSLQEIRKQLEEDCHAITIDQKSLDDQFDSIKVFSNISDIAQSIKLHEVIQKIVHIKSQRFEHILKYTMVSIQYFFPTYLREKARFIPLNREIMEKLQKYLHQLTVIRKPLETILDSKTNGLIKQHLGEQFQEIEQQIAQVKGMYDSTTKYIHDLVTKYRSVPGSQDSAEMKSIGTNYEKLSIAIENVIKYRQPLEEKLKIIIHCHEKGIKYSNLAEFFLLEQCTLENIEQHLLNTTKVKKIFCFDDKLEKPNTSEWKKFYTMLLNERQKDSQLDLTYADFSYCSCRLSQTKVLPTNVKREEQKSSWTPQSSPTLSTKTYSTQVNSQNDNIINILLLGESGVGKSTFVNALVNYLHFKSLKQACSQKPIVVMPVSFLLTTGHNFDEHIVRLGEEDPNENHNNIGQSVTQQCKSYVFTIGTRTKLRLIDTPGMGDTRGLEQDDRNMHHILSFINNLPHLNAICILLKPNESKLNVVFRTYLTQLIGFLGEDVRNNIVFCFTNTRSTFFAPGDTGPVLRKMLNEHSIQNIPFKKENTFCFDNESFRYLVALLDGIEFDDYQKEEYKQSWIISVDESNRFLKYISKELKFYSRKEWQSVDHAHFQIIQLIRPLLETMRNLFRNLILQENNQFQMSIKLYPNSLSHPSTICMTCYNHPEYHADFWILPDNLHSFSDKCDRCNCSHRRHIDVDYRLDYKVSTDAKTQSGDKIKLYLDELKTTILDFGYFTMNISQSFEPSDPFLSYLNEMIEQEYQIYKQNDGKCLNSHLHKKLNEFKEEYERQQQQRLSQSNKNLISLENIYKLMQKVSEMNSIKEQVTVMKLAQQNYMNKQEKQIN